MTSSARSLASFRSERFSLEALAAAATRQLRALDLDDVQDGRVAATPDARGLRYYQTLGLIDKPLAYEGRRAVYGYRHLLQLLAVKRLQQEGYPLAVIQAKLPPMTDEELEAGLIAAAASAPATGVRGNSRPGVSVAAPAATRTVITGEVAPGIVLTIDPSRVANAERVFAAAVTLLADITGEVDATRDH